ncbi:MAG TPA: NAD-dependent epimerase/dehydratase family protein, partial [Gemmatimonadales bacterium]
MKIFVTGGSGLVGSHTIRALTARGDQVLALSRSTAADAALREMGAEPMRGDIGEEPALVRGVQMTDATVHAAAVVLARAGWAKFHATNVAPTETVARVCGRGGKRLIHVSSVSAYGRATTYDGGAGSVTEEFGIERPIFKGDYYARSKR